MNGASSHRPYDSTDRQLEAALVANFVVHGVAMLGMAVLLLPMLPGGTATSDAARIGAIAAHPWRFRVGWLPWQLCAVADLGLAVAMVRSRFLPKLPTMLVLVATGIAVLPDQYAQALWVTRGVDLARAGDDGAYLAFERAIFPLTAAWGALFYTIAALFWTWAFAAGGTWSRLLTALSVPLWLTMLIAVTGPLLPAPIRPSPRFVSTANGLGFLQLELWLALVAEQVLRRARPGEPSGRLARFRDAHPGVGGRIVDLVANSRLLGYPWEAPPGADDA